MLTYLYDSTFPGLMTCIYQAYATKRFPLQIIRTGQNGLLFGEMVTVATNEEQSLRVWEGIKRYGGILSCEQVFHSFLSLDRDVEMLILAYCRELFEAKTSIANNYGSDSVLRLNQLQRRVMREAHRMLMFARFERAADGTWFAPLAPQYDVIPLITGHFKLRFTDQPWLVYDTRRNYGFFYDTKTLEQITIDNPMFSSTTGNLDQAIIHPDEEKWQQMWKTYFKQIAIKERTNPQCQQNFMPKRFWKYLTEKKM